MPHLSGTEPSGHLTLQPRRDAYSVLKEMFLHSVMNSNKDFIVCFWFFFTLCWFGHLKIVQDRPKHQELVCVVNFDLNYAPYLNNNKHILLFTRVKQYFFILKL